MKQQRLRAALTRIAATATAAALALGGLAVAAAPAQAATAPIAVDDHFEMTTGTTLTVGKPGVLSNDTAPDIDAWLQVNETTDPAQGTVSWDSVFGGFSYTPPIGFIGTATFTYKVMDAGVTYLTDWGTVTIDVKPVGQPVVLPPVAVDDNYKFAPETPLYIAAPGLLGNDSPNSGTATISVDYLPPNTPLQLNADGSFYFATDSTHHSLKWFDYRLCNEVTCSVARVQLTLVGPGEQPSGPSTPPTPVNAAPTAAPDTFDVVAGTRTTISAAEGLLANDSDAEGDALTVKSIGYSGQGLTPHGVVNGWNADGSITYTPNAGWQGTDRISYTLSDGGHEVTGTIDWVVTEPANYAPTALRDEAAVRSGTKLLLPLGGVLANDTDLDGDALTVTAHTDPEHGTATVAANGEVRYTPDAGFVGADEFDYTVSDGTATDTGTLVIAVTAPDAAAAPIALGNRYRTEPRGSSADVLSVPAPGLLGNDGSPSGKPLTVTTTGDTAHGQVVMQPDGAFTYTPSQGFTGTASFDYEISDGTGTAHGRVAILVGGEPVPADPALAAFDAAPAPTVSGTAQVGRTLSASTGDWAPGAETLGYQWLRGGTPILGATGATYRLVAADVNARISVRVAAQRWGYQSTVRVSAAKKVAPARLTATPTPKITGIAKKGRTLTAKAGSWKPGPVTLKYRWLRNGKAIRGATKAKYRLTAKDRGTRISVRVTASKPGYATATKRSTAKRIAR